MKIFLKGKHIVMMGNVSPAILDHYLLTQLSLQNIVSLCMLFCLHEDRVNSWQSTNIKRLRLIHGHSFHFYILLFT